MSAIYLEPVATPLNFDEAGYLEANPDVRRAVKTGQFRSGRHYFDQIGKSNGKKVRLPNTLEIISEMKKKKHERIRPLLKTDMPLIEEEHYFDFMTEDLRNTFNIVDTNNVSSNEYSENPAGLIKKHNDGLVLDCGSGRTPVYYDNVVNYEIVAYDTTDVVGVGEALPFINDCFDAVISVAVLEHVKDPFTCANEIARVLKPGGDLICSVPFLQPMHGYPHHYYNMTSSGLRNLFDQSLVVDSVICQGRMRPIGSLTWVLSEWAFGLQGKTREEFLNMRVADLVSPPESYFERSFVNELPEAVNIKLASSNMLFAHKE